MNDEEYHNNTIKRYQGFYKKYGHNMQSLGWKSEEKMKKRFEALFKIGILYSDDSILDVGCGFGDFIYILESHYIGTPYIMNKYTGIDIVPEFLEIAEGKYPYNKVKFKLSTIFYIKKKYDWIFGS